MKLKTKINDIIHTLLRYNYTQKDVFKYFDDKYHFTCDVASSRWNSKCEKYFTKKDDALQKSWSGICWMNPPWSESLVWIGKALSESRGNVVVVGLFPYCGDLIHLFDILSKHCETKMFYNYRYSIFGKKYKFPVIGIVFKKETVMLWENKVERKKLSKS